MITALCPFIGYKRASEIAKGILKTGVPVRKLVVQKGIVSADEVDEILNPFKLALLREGAGRAGAVHKEAPEQVSNRCKSDQSPEAMRFRAFFLNPSRQEGPENILLAPFFTMVNYTIKCNNLGK